MECVLNENNYNLMLNINYFSEYLKFKVLDSKCFCMLIDILTNFFIFLFILEKLLYISTSLVKYLDRFC